MDDIEVVIDNRLRMDAYAMPSDFRQKLEREFTYANPQHARLVAMGQPYTKEPKYYVMWNQLGSTFSLPRGGMQKLRDAFNEFNLDYVVDDRRSMGCPSITGSYVDGWQIGLDLFPKHKKVAWEHQVEIVDAIEQFSGQLLVRSPTGSGKTTAIVKHIAEAQVPALVIMWDSGLLKQWQERIEEELGIPVSEQGIIRGQKFRLKSITLAMQQTLTRWDDKKWSRLLHEGKSIFGGVYCDEVQRYAARTFINQVDRFDSHYRVGVSADERRKDKKTFIIYDMFGDVRHEVSKAQLVKKRIIHEVECFVYPTQFKAEWYRLKAEDRLVDLTDFQRLVTEMSNDEERNQLVLRLIEGSVKAGRPTLTFTQQVAHVHLLNEVLLERGIASGLALGGAEMEDEFDKTIAGLRDGTLQSACGTYGKLGVGHDIPTVATGVAVTPVHNNRSFMGQVKGRICRTSEGKQDARIIVLWDRLVYGDGPLFNLKRWNDVCNVWDEWDQEWKPINKYMQEMSNGHRSGDAPTSSTDDLFVDAN